MKHNARWYDNRIAEKQEELTQLQAIIEAKASWTEADNALHDQEYALEQEIVHLERGKKTRNWTAADWSNYDLASSNID